MCELSLVCGLVFFFDFMCLGLVPAPVFVLVTDFPNFQYFTGSIFTVVLYS